MSFLLIQRPSFNEPEDHMRNSESTSSFTRLCCSRNCLPTVTLVIGCVYIFYLFHFTSTGGIWDKPRKKITDPAHRRNNENSLIWAVSIDKVHNKDKIDKIADDLDLVNLGQVGHLEDKFLFAHKLESSFSLNKTVSTVHRHHSELYSQENIAAKIDEIEKRLDNHDGIGWYSHQKVLSRGNRYLGYKVPFMNFNDPFYRNQWHLSNSFDLGMDINITGVWERNITGRGVTACVVDDGLEWNNPDLQENYNKAGSWDLNDGDDDPAPDTRKSRNHHGTRCAGEISAVPNNVCGVGVAYRSKISGLRLLDGPLTDSLEAEAFTKFFQINDIYSCSWGPDDDGRTVDGPHILAAASMKHGIDFGRRGYGSIYVVASGNGGGAGDNCNYDGYANSMYTVTIGAVDETGHMPAYSEECASMVAVTFSSGSEYKVRDIVTTDWTAHKESVRGCTMHHSGTSAAAPIAAGLIALMLEVQPCLTWRDVQYLIALTALKVDIDVAHWHRNGAGLWHSHKHGFGLMNAWRLVNAVKVWDQVPWHTSFAYSEMDISVPITKGTLNPLTLSYTVSARYANSYDLYIVETAQVTLTLNHPRRGHLAFNLESPSGTMSVIGAARPHDDSPLGFDQWTFSTVRCWGESPVGTWTFTITDSDSSARYSMGTLRSWTLKVFGTPMTPTQFKERMKKVKEALHGRFLNSSGQCIPPPVTNEPDVIMSVRILKMIVLLGTFCFVFGMYSSFEYILCYNDEKNERSKLVKLLKRAHRMARQHLYWEGSQSRLSENSGLLGNNISLDTFQSINDSDNARSAGAYDRSRRSNINPNNTDNVEMERSVGSANVRSHNGNSVIQNYTSDSNSKECDKSLSNSITNSGRASPETVLYVRLPKQPLFSHSGTHGQGHPIIDRLKEVQSKVKVSRQTTATDGYRLLPVSSDESETEF